MSVRGGDVRQLTVDGRELAPADDVSVNIDAGGFENESKLTGNGLLHINQKRKVAGFSDFTISADDSDNDLKFVQDLSNAGSAVPVTMTLASGKVYSGQLAVTGEVAKNTGDGTITLEMRGAKFEQI